MRERESVCVKERESVSEQGIGNTVCVCVRERERGRQTDGHKDRQTEI
jgi:hypothetical protein